MQLLAFVGIISVGCIATMLERQGFGLQIIVLGMGWLEVNSSWKMGQVQGLLFIEARGEVKVGKAKKFIVIQIGGSHVTSCLKI